MLPGEKTQYGHSQNMQVKRAHFRTKLRLFNETRRAQVARQNSLIKRTEKQNSSSKGHFSFPLLSC